MRVVICCGDLSLGEPECNGRPAHERRSGSAETGQAIRRAESLLATRRGGIGSHPKRIGALGCSWGVLVLQTRIVGDGTETAPHAFSEFFAEHYARLVRACLLLTGTAAEGEDLAQEAMARVFERWDRVSGMDDPEGYLYRTALNLHRNAIKRLAMAARRRVAPQATDEAGMTERRIDLLRAIRPLPRTQREVLMLVGWLGYTAEEAGSLLGIDAASVRGRLHRARASLRKTYGGFDD